ncbi:MAG: DUF6677 family protein [Candidatus Brocadiia bacterium]
MKIIYAALLGWLIPGAGHWLYGKKLKAWLILELVVLTLIIGIILSDFRSIRFYDNPFYYLSKFGCGLVFLISQLFTSFTPAGRIPMAYHDIGLLFVSIGGALNLVVLLSLFQPPAAETTKKENN